MTTDVERLVGRLRAAAVNKGLSIGEALNLLDEAADKLDRIRLALEHETECPCCGERETCCDECSFAGDCPAECDRMMFMRTVLSSNEPAHSRTAGASSAAPCSAGTPDANGE